MHLTPTEMDRLTIFTAAELARRRRAKGWKLTHPEALAIICDEMHEAAKIECLFGDGMRILHVEGAIGPGRAAPARRT
jgi:urease gamma subunit